MTQEDGHVRKYLASRAYEGARRRRPPGEAAHGEEPLVTLVDGAPRTLAERLAASDRALSKILESLHTMRALSVHASGRTMTEGERAAAQAELDRLKEDIERLSRVLSAARLSGTPLTEAEMEENVRLIDNSLEGVARRVAALENRARQVDTEKWMRWIASVQQD